MIISRLDNENNSFGGYKKIEIWENKIIHLQSYQDYFLLISGTSIIRVESQHNLYISDFDNWHIGDKRNTQLYLKHKIDYDKVKAFKICYGILNKKIIFKRRANNQAFIIDFSLKSIDVFNYDGTKGVLGKYDDKNENAI
jgi:hypothetical protein